MTKDGNPVSIYDLAYFMVSSDYGRTTYLIVSDVPMAKVNVTQLNPSQRALTIHVSQTVLDSFVTYASIPSVTTEVGTIGDWMSTFKILSINPVGVAGESTSLGTCCPSITIHVGDNVAIACEGLSKTLAWIDDAHQTAAFTVTRQARLPAGCPIITFGGQK